MTTTARKPKVDARLVEMMTGFYGTIEAAREAYRAERATMRPGEVLWVSPRGRVMRKSASDVLYSGSADAWGVLPS